MQTYLATQINLLKTTRSNIQKITDNFSLDQLNIIPDGYSNNLIWNFGHVIVTQQLLVYGLSGLPMKLENEIIEKYRKGTRPESKISQKEYDYLKTKFLELPIALEKDFQESNLSNFKTYSTSYGFTLNSMQDAIIFNNIHEAMHYGTMLGIRKFLG